ncbi:hypothetical protein TGAMA5MH_05588 [Trichoderma gamsii]|uniref:Uncharacterized protein n=1 Tax=Trichoderma gamsii TaxID=398673 RepID=A0A2K0TBE2_9HYPO|nr:hypothetical protein TGAMA5MH_05588 [Trichoderma gamsii]
MIFREASSVTVSAESSSQMQILDPGQSRASRTEKRCVVTFVWGRDVIGSRPFAAPLLQTA